VKKEAMVESVHSEGVKGDDSSQDTQGSDVTPVELRVGKLSLKEGQKIHINIKGVEGKARKKSQGSGISPVLKPMLLKKPPPPASAKGAGRDKVENPDESGDKPVAEEASTADDDDDNDDHNDDEDDWGDFESGASNSS
jgi:hypothetical protein